MINQKEIDEIRKYTALQKKASWGINEIKIGDEMDEISEFITDGDISGRYAAALVFEELFVNVSNYAYPDKSGPLLVSVSVTEEGTEMVFVDSGVPFDPTKYVPKKSENDDKIGGHGIELIIDYSKQIEYKRVFGMNMLRLVV